MDIYKFLEDKQYTLKQKIEEIKDLSSRMSEKGASINDVGYAMLLKTALEHTNIGKEKDLAEKIKGMVEELEDSVKNKRPVGMSNYGFQKRIKTILNQ
ncbi:MAG: hypothetical protein QW404_01445 [Candidatus Nanoarchaeia archaeon]